MTPKRLIAAGAATAAAVVLIASPAYGADVATTGLKANAAANEDAQTRALDFFAGQLRREP